MRETHKANQQLLIKCRLIYHSRKWKAGAKGQDTAQLKCKKEETKE